MEVLKKVYRFFSSVFLGLVAEGIWLDDKGWSGVEMKSGTKEALLIFS